MIDTQAIRNKILDLAVRGQLTEQSPEDGTAEELYQQVQEEKQRLIKAGKIKKGNPLPAITIEEIPYRIPASWKWIRWGDVVNIVSARRVHKADWRKTGVPFYRAREIAKLAENGFVENDLFISEELYEEFSKSGVPHENDLMVSAVGTLGKTYVVQKNDRFYYKDASVLCFENYGKINPYFLVLVMKSNMMRVQIGSNSEGTTVDTLTMVRMVKYLLPLPPLAEQQRIVEKIDQAFSVLDTIDTLQAQYADNLTTLKAKLIDAAIQGKLTEQLSEDGTAEELYQQIQTEKQALIKAGKIKKEKPLSEITADEIPFEIPENWKWCRIGEIFTLQAGKNIATGSIQDHPDSDNRYPCYGGNGLRGYVNQFNVNGLHALIGRQGALCGNINLASGEFYATEHAVVVYEYSGTSMQWAGLTLRALNLNQYATSVAQPGLAVNKINKVLIPLPPLAEQKRIAQKIDELMPLFEKRYGR